MAPPTLTSRTDAALLLGWTAPALYASPLITYEVEVDNGTAATEFTTGISLLDSGLTPTQKLWYRVRAQTAYGYGEWSAPVSFEAEAAAPVVLSISAGSLDRTSMLWSWSAAIGNGHPVTGYEAQIEVRGSSTWLANEVGLSRSWRTEGLQPYTGYRLRVRANSTGFPAYGLWKYSGYYYTRDYPAAPLAPTPRAELGGFSNVTTIWFEWDAPPSYGLPVLEYQMNNDGVIASTGTSAFRILADLSPSTAYSASVRARNAMGWGNWSNTTVVVTAESTGNFCAI